MSDSISMQDSGVLMEMTVCDVGTLDREMRGHGVAMLQRLLAEGRGILCW